MKMMLKFLDPLFFLHHCDLDRVLWNWQQKDLPRRLPVGLSCLTTVVRISRWTLRLTLASSLGM